MTDILIHDMEVPKHCIDCPCMVDKYGGDNCCLQSEEANEKIESWDDMKAGCPLIELPEHGDLIDRDAFMNDIQANDYPVNVYGNPASSGMSTSGIKRIVNNAPVVIPSNKETKNAD